MAPTNTFTVEIDKPFFPTPPKELHLDRNVTQLRVTLPANCTAQPRPGQLPKTIVTDAGGAYTFAITVPRGDQPGKPNYFDYSLLLTDESGQSGPSTIRVKPMGLGDPLGDGDEA